MTATTTADAVDRVDARSPIDRTGVLVAAGMAAVLTIFSVLRYRNYWAGSTDLGVFDQGVWLMSRGLAPEVTVNGRNLFADHLSPVLVLFVPLYWLAATPMWLFVGQAVALGATVLPLRALARHEGVPLWMATLPVACSAPLVSAAMFEFHPSTLAVPLVAFMLLEVRRGDDRRAVVAAVLILFCRADLGWLVIGAAVIADARLRRKLLLLGVVGIAGGLGVPAVLGARGSFGAHYGHLGSGPIDVLLHPWRLMVGLLEFATLQKAMLWLLPVAFLPLRRPRWLLALVVSSTPILLSHWGGTSQAWYHYGAPLFPIAMAGALVALGGRRQPSWLDRRLVPGATVIALLAMSPVSPAAPASFRVWKVVGPQAGVDLHAALSQVRADAPVAASNRVLAHLTHRREAWLLPAPFGKGGPVPDLASSPSAQAGARLSMVIVAPERQRELRLARAQGFRGTVRDGVFVGRR